jgi:hypothetical protein
MIMEDFLEFLRLLIRNWRAKKRNSFSYSQRGEDLAIRKFLPESHGSYVDIGCGNPVIESNTYLLYKRGWSGHMIDAWKMNCTVGKFMRRRDTFGNFAVNVDGKTLDFYLFDPYQYSTADEGIYKDLLAQKIQYRRKIEIKGLRISDLNLKIRPDLPSFLSIDVEGLDLEVLTSNNWDEYTPRVVCIEKISVGSNSTLEAELFNRNEDIHSLLTDKGYDLVETCGPSCIYVHSTYLENLSMGAHVQ